MSGGGSPTSGGGTPAGPAPESLGEALAGAIPSGDTEVGEVEVEHGGQRARARIREAGPIGVVLDEVEVDTPDPAPLDRRSRHLAERIRPGGERMVEVECDAGLGGAVVRSDPRDMRGRRYFQVDLDGDGRHRLSRHEVGDDGSRAPVPFPMTRDELGRTVDGMAEEPPPEVPPHPIEELLDG